MPYDPQAELKRVIDYYNSDPLQERFSALVTGESGSGKTYLARTCRLPIHIDSFDPGGSKSLQADPGWPKDDPRRITSLRTKDNPQGQIVADTRWENEDPYAPSAYEQWEKDTDIRFEIGYYNIFGTYMLDSLSTFADAVMNSVLNTAGIAGKQPRFRHDYTPQKVALINRIKKFMTLQCDFIVTGHLDRFEEPTGRRDKYGDEIRDVKFRLRVTGNAVVTVPMQFDELYIVKNDERNGEISGEIITYAQDKYLARSRLRGEGKLDTREEADIKKLLQKIGLDWEDKPRLELE